MKISLVVPCYNEEEILPRTVRELTGFLNECRGQGLVSADSEIIFVDDGSRDRTWELITEAAQNFPEARGVKLSRNRGHQNALLAGLAEASGDFMVTIDADLQDDVAAIGDLIRAAEGGSDIVLGVRRRRDADSFFKKYSALGFYRLMKVMGVDIVPNHADFRGMSRRTVEALFRHQEVNLFLRGLVPELGYPTSIVYYDRLERLAGETKYPLRKMLAFAWQGITSFSTVPLKLATVAGLSCAALSLLIVAWALVIRFFTDETVPGWTSTVTPLVFLAGVQLLGLGVIGEYLGKIYLEVKRRPRYFVEKTAGWDSPGRNGEGEGVASNHPPGRGGE